MSRERIKRLAFYLVGIEQGISGLRGPTLPAIVTGARLKRDLLRPWVGDRLGILEHRTFRLENGRLPEYQPRGSMADALEHLQINPFAAAYIE